MRFQSLSALKRPAPQEIALGSLPDHIRMTAFAKEKAFKINELVRELYQDSYEWYGFTLAERNDPELILDLGLPVNEQNVLQYTRVHPEKIGEFQESLAPELVINGWIHSHGRLNLQQFSEVDADNQVTVLDYVTAALRRPLAKREIPILEVALLVAGTFQEDDLKAGSVTVITDKPVSAARIMETVYGGFSYSIVVGDEGWHHQEIYHQERGILSGWTQVSQRQADIVMEDTGRELNPQEVAALRREVKAKIKAETYSSPKMESL